MWVLCAASPRWSILSSDRRIEEVEAKLAHQEVAVSDLNDVIYRQQKQIDQLERGYARLLQRFADLVAMADADKPADAPPPHY
jgi:SlyX protein